MGIEFFVWSRWVYMYISSPCHSFFSFPFPFLTLFSQLHNIEKSPASESAAAIVCCELERGRRGSTYNAWALQEK